MRPPLDIEELEERIREGSKSIDEHFNLAYLYLDSGDYESALELYDKLKRLPLTSLDMARVFCETGEALRESNRADEAVKAYQRALAVLMTEQESVEMLLLNGLCHSRLSFVAADEESKKWHAQRALEFLNPIVSRNLTLPETYVVLSPTYLKYNVCSHIADMYLSVGDYDASLEFYKRSLPASATPYERVCALVGIATVYSAKREYGIAAKYYKEALRKVGKDVPTAKVYFQMAEMYYEAGRFSESQKAFTNAMKKRDQDPHLKDNREFQVETLYYLGLIAYKKVQHRKALDYFRRILELVADDHPLYSLTRLHLGHMHFKDEEYAKAIEEYKLVISAPRPAESVVEEAKEYLSYASNALMPSSPSEIVH